MLADVPANTPVTGDPTTWAGRPHHAQPARLGDWPIILLVAAAVLSAAIAWWYPAAVKDYYLLFHSIAEMFAVVISAGIFMVAWNSRRFIQNNYLLWVGIGYLSVAVLELLHALAYRGMGVFAGRGTNLPTQLWIASRYVEAITLLIAPVFLTRRVRPWATLAGFAAVTAAIVLTTAAWPLFPAAYDNLAGRLTPFKVASEYIICGMLAASAAMLLWRNRGQFARRPLAFMIASICMTILAELAFTRYSDPYGPANLFGHLLTVTSFFLIYKAVIETGLRDPYEIMFNRLRLSEERYRELFVSMSEGFSVHEAICDPAGRCIDYRFLGVNPAFERLTGLKAADILGRTVLDVLPDTEPIWIERFGRVALTGQPDQFSHFSAALGRHYEVYAFCPVPGQFAVVFMDITARKRIEQSLRESQARLNELNGELEQRVRDLGSVNSELEAFAYSVSHDLRAPLRAIDGFSQALLEDCAGRLDVDGQQYLDRIRSASQRMGQLIDDILALSRVTRAALSPQRVDLSRMAREITDNLTAIEPTRAVQFVIHPGLEAEADARLLRIVLENLLGNAYKFTSRTPEARIEFGAVASPDSPGQMEYYVRDNGAGFDPRYVHKLFGAFQRLHRTEEFPGSGIGLATVQRIIRRHGGQVRAEGEIGKGATIRFCLGQLNREVE